MVAPSNNAHGGPFKSEGIDHYLVDFLEEVYAPIMLRGKSERYKSYFRETVKYLGESLRRQPRFSDLNVYSLGQLCARLYELSADRRKSLRTAFRSIWLLAFQLGRAPTAPPERKYLTIYRERPTRVRKPRAPKPAMVGGPGTLVDYHNRTYLPQSLCNSGPQHRKDVLAMLKLLRDCFRRDLLLPELNASTLAQFVEWLRQQAYATRSVKNIRVRLLGLWRFASDAGAAPPVPRIPIIRLTHEQPDAWSLEEVGRIVATARRFEALPIGGIPACKYWPALLLVSFYTGLRRRALLAIRPSDLDLEGRWLYAPASSMKNGRGMKFRLGVDACAAVTEILNEHASFVFRFEVNKKRLSHQFGQILKNAGVAPSRMKLGLFHKMRRTTATHVAVKAGIAAASALLGHSTADLLKRYIDPSYMVGTDATEWLSAPTP